jgi:hypothetical protein
VSETWPTIAPLPEEAVAAQRRTGGREVAAGVALLAAAVTVTVWLVAMPDRPHPRKLLIMLWVAPFVLWWDAGRRFALCAVATTMPLVMDAVSFCESEEKGWIRKTTEVTYWLALWPPDAPTDTPPPVCVKVDWPDAASFDAEPVLLYGDHQAGGWAVIRTRHHIIWPQSRLRAGLPPDGAAPADVPPLEPDRLKLEALRWPAPPTPQP